MNRWLLIGGGLVGAGSRSTSFTGHTPTDCSYECYRIYPVYDGDEITKLEVVILRFLVKSG